MLTISLFLLALIAGCKEGTSYASWDTTEIFCNLFGHIQATLSKGLELLMERMISSVSSQKQVREQSTHSLSS